MATTISIWRGYRDWDKENDCWNWDAESYYERVTYEGAKEIGSVRFEDADSDIQYRIIRTADNEIVVFFVERKGHYVEAEIFEYPDLETAAEQYWFILKKAGVI